MSAVSLSSPASERRKTPRLNFRCRARIRVGNRHYAGYIEDISNDGARIRTLTPLRETGPVYLLIPDLPPIRGHVRWRKPDSGGVCFSMSVAGPLLAEWARSRMASVTLQSAQPGSADLEA